MPYHNRYLTGVLFVILTFIFSCQGTSFFNSEAQLNHKIFLYNWKFIPKDDLTFSKTDYNDSTWYSIRADSAFQYPDFDSYSWYRNTCIITDSIKEGVKDSDSLKIVFDKLMGPSELYLNGSLVSNKVNYLSTDTGKCFFSVSIRDHRIHWNKKNTIALRYFDTIGGGILKGNVPYISKTSLEDSIILNKNAFYKPDKGELRDTTLDIRNSSRLPLNGTIKIRCSEVTSDELLHKESFELALAPGEIKSFPVSIPITKEKVRVDLMYHDQKRNGHLKLDNWKILPYVLLR